MEKALLIFNIQNDFCDGGVMSVINSIDIIPKINKIREIFEIVILIKNVYPPNHIIFKNEGAKLYCIENTLGSEFNDGIIVSDEDHIIEIGKLYMHDSNSAFYYAPNIGKESNLNSILKKNKVKELYFTGINVKGFIFNTAIDAKKFKYDCIIIDDLCATDIQDSKQIEKCNKFLDSISIKILNSENI